MRWTRRSRILLAAIAIFELFRIPTSAFAVQRPPSFGISSLSRHPRISRSQRNPCRSGSALGSTSSKKPDTSSSLLRDVIDFLKQIIIPPSHQIEKPQLKAWQCHGESQRSLVHNLKEANIVRSDEVQKVMEAVDRKYYISDNPLEASDIPYLDRPLSIAQGQTISAPHMHAHVLEHILPAIQHNAQRGSVKILDVGCGSGYLTACFGRWFHAEDKKFRQHRKSTLQFDGQVFGMDIHSDLCEFTRANILKNDGDLLESETIRIDVGNGWLGLPEEAPFDAIHVGAAASTFPEELAKQLSLGGVLVVPVGDKSSVQTLMKMKRLKVPGQDEEASFSWEDYEVTNLLGVRYVPLVEKPIDEDDCS